MSSWLNDGIDHCFRCRVYVEDTDLMGIVYHANYLRFFERARIELFRQAGISLTTMATNETYLAIHDLHIQYKAPARLDEELTITTHCEQKKSCSLIFRQVMHNESQVMLCEVMTQVVCVNQQLKPKRIAFG